MRVVEIIWAGWKYGWCFFWYQLTKLLKRTAAVSVREKWILLEIYQVLASNKSLFSLINNFMWHQVEGTSGTAVFTSKIGLIQEVKMPGTLAENNHVMIKIIIPRRRTEKSQTFIFLRKADLDDQNDDGNSLAWKSEGKGREEILRSNCKQLLLEGKIKSI